MCVSVRRRQNTRARKDARNPAYKLGEAHDEVLATRRICAQKTPRKAARSKFN